jgi:hypothetical protein
MGEFRLILPNDKGILGSVDEKGILSFVIAAGQGSPIRGTEMFDLMMRAFGEQVKAILGIWRRGKHPDESTNIDTSARFRLWGSRKDLPERTPSLTCVWKESKQMFDGFEQGEADVGVVQHMRALTSRGADVAEVAAFVLGRLNLPRDKALLALIIYFRSAFCLSLREALPLREWLNNNDRSEIDSILIPAMQRTEERWKTRQMQQA